MSFQTNQTCFSLLKKNHEFGIKQVVHRGVKRLVLRIKSNINISREKYEFHWEKVRGKVGNLIILFVVLYCIVLYCIVLYCTN